MSGAGRHRLGQATIPASALVTFYREAHGGGFYEPDESPAEVEGLVALVEASGLVTTAPPDWVPTTATARTSGHE